MHLSMQLQPPDELLGPSPTQTFLRNPVVGVVSFIGNLVSIFLIIAQVSGAVFMFIPFLAIFICFVVLRIIEARRIDTECLSVIPVGMPVQIEARKQPKFDFTPQRVLEAPQPNIVAFNETISNQCVASDGFAFRKTLNNTTHVAVIAKFENVPNPPEKVGGADKVCARVSYNVLPLVPFDEGIVNTPINHACWLDHEGAFIDFPLNTPRRLILGLFETNPPEFPLSVKVGAPMNVFGISPETRRPAAYVAVGGGSEMIMLIKVDLIIGEFGEWTRRFEYILRTHSMMGPVDLTLKSEPKP